MSRCASKQATKNRLGPVHSESGTPDGQRPEVLEFSHPCRTEFMTPHRMEEDDTHRGRSLSSITLGSGASRRG